MEIMEHRKITKREELNQFLVWLIETFEIHNLQNVDIDNITNLYLKEGGAYFG